MIGCSGNDIEVNEGRASLVLDGVISIYEPVEKIDEALQGNRCQGKSLEPWSRQGINSLNNTGIVLESSEVNADRFAQSSDTFAYV